jgi:drug/metabolite transporter (DMT)-like permease
MVTFIYTAPIFAAIGLHLLHPQERLRRVQWLGIICAFIGVTISFFTHDTSTGGASSGSTLLGDTLGVVAGALWGGLTVLVRSTGLATAPPVEGLMYQLVGGCVVLTSCAPFLGAWYFTVSAISWFSLVLQTVLIAMASFFGWLWLLSRYNASELGALSFMTPVFGTMLGIALLGEPLYPSFIIGSALVFLGILLVNGSAVLSSTLTRLLHRYR